MTQERFIHLLRRLRRWYRYNPVTHRVQPPDYLVDEWLSETAAECDEAQWGRVCERMGWR